MFIYTNKAKSNMQRRDGADNGGGFVIDWHHILYWLHACMCGGLWLISGGGVV